MERLMVIGALSAIGVGMGACGSEGGSEGAETVTQTKTIIERAPRSDSSPGGGTDSAGGGDSGGERDSGGGRWTMPDLRGKDLQGAQDEIQSLTGGEIFYSGSHDASGQGRTQILDRGWQVCTQEPGPGEKLTPDTEVDFGVVRESEQCP